MIAVGRPVTYTQEDRDRIAEHICNELANKRFISSILREDEGMPSPAQWARWLAEDTPDAEVLREKVARAREAGVEAHLEDMIAIADDATGDAEVAYDAQGKAYVKMDGDNVQRAKTRIYAREKMAQMLTPRRFGQKLDVTSDGKALPAPQVNVTQLADNRVQTLIALAAQRKAAKQKLLDD